MVSVQIWLDANYPREERWKIRKLDLSNKNLTGDLDLRDFRDLEEVNISGNPQIGELLNTEERGIIVKMDAQRWIDKKYPRREKRSEITILRIYKEDLESFLDLEDFVNLREFYCSYNGLTGLNLSRCSHLQKLDCSNNKLTELDLSNCQNITKVDFSNNLLTDFDFNSLNSETLAALYIKKNNFTPRDLSCFARFNNLESLLINDNPFFGSLKPLENCLKLKELSIGATKINSGLEYLPVSLQKIWFWNLEEGNSITEELRNYKEWGGMYDNYYYDLSRWKKGDENLNKERAIDLIKRTLRKLGLENSQLTNERWEQIIEQASDDDYEQITFCCQSALIDALTVAFQQSHLRVPENFLYEIYGRRGKPIPELVSEKIRSTKGIVSLESAINSLYIKQKSIILIINALNKTKNPNLAYFFSTSFMQLQSIINEESAEKAVACCQDVIKGLIFKAPFGSINRWIRIQDIEEKIKEAQTIEQLELIFEELLSEIVEKYKKELVSLESGIGDWHFNLLTENEKQLISSASDIDSLEKVVEEVKKMQFEEKKLRNEVIDILQNEFERLELKEKDLEEKYIKSRWEGRYVPSLQSLIRTETTRKIFKDKVGSRLSDDLKTIEEIKKFEQEAKFHMLEMARIKAETELTKLQAQIEVNPYGQEVRNLGGE